MHALICIKVVWIKS